MRNILLTLLLFVSTTYSQEKFTVYFDFDIHQVNAPSSEKLSDWLLQNKNIEVLKIEGFCDSVGSHDYNDQLSLRRIQSVLKTLKENKISLSRALILKGYGKRFEQSSIQSDNRKVTISYSFLPQKFSDAVKKSKVGDKLRLKNLNFYNNSGIVVPKSEPVLEELLEILLQNPKLSIAIQGHICCQPQGDVNDISTLRAVSVYNYLIENGIKAERLSYKGFGSTQPLYPIPENNEFERDENRRVEIQILKNE